MVERRKAWHECIGTMEELRELNGMGGGGWISEIDEEISEGLGSVL